MILRFVALILLLLLLPDGAAAAAHPRIEERAACATGRCHAAFAKASAGMQSVHEPVSSGACRACHDLALAAQAYFLKGVRPEETASPARGAKAWDVALCAGCHEELLLVADGLGTGTGFIAARRDLHALHVRAAQGRGCITCHDPHAAPQPHLLRREIPARGKLRIPQRFREQIRGGVCQTGCHAPKSYTRDGGPQR